MVVIQPLDKEGKLCHTSRKVNEMCTYLIKLLGEDACNTCTFRDGCQVEGMPKYWLEEK